MIAGALLAGLSHAQDAKPAETPSEATQAKAKDASKTEEAIAKVADDLKKKEKIRVLKPDELASEIIRLKTKADIKAELNIRTAGGRPLVFKGVIRNGKLIERIVNRRFVTQKDVTHRHAGVRLWWSGNSDGYIFFRYANIQTVTITGKLTAKEREEILRRLRASDEEAKDPEEQKKLAAAAAAKLLPDLEKLTTVEREKWLMARFLTAQGWSSHRYRDLKRRQILEDKELSAEEAIFVKYFSVLEQARFRDLRTRPIKKEKFEPGSAESDGSSDKSEKSDKPANKSDQSDSDED